eukprot:356041-Chlamydomonas_euryale.AAC.6
MDSGEGADGRWQRCCLHPVVLPAVPAWTSVFERVLLSVENVWPKRYTSACIFTRWMRIGEDIHGVWGDLSA